METISPPRTLGCPLGMGGGQGHTLKSRFSDVDLPWETPAATTEPEWIMGPSCKAQGRTQILGLRSQGQKARMFRGTLPHPLPFPQPVRPLLTGSLRTL